PARPRTRPGPRSSARTSPCRSSRRSARAPPHRSGPEPYRTCLPPPSRLCGRSPPPHVVATPRAILPPAPAFVERVFVDAGKHPRRSLVAPDADQKLAERADQHQERPDDEEPDADRLQRLEARQEEDAA